MKKIVWLVVATVALVTTAHAQHETLFNRAKVVGGFGAPLFEISLDNKFESSAGGGGGVVINNFFIGGYGMGSVDFDALFEGDPIDRLEIAHGGFWLGMSFPSHKLIHGYLDARIGWGVVDVDLEDNNVRYRDLDKIFVFTPEIGLELNVARWFRITGAAGYRLVNGVSEANGLTNENFSGAIATVGLRFGWFGWRRY